LERIVAVLLRHCVTGTSLCEAGQPEHTHPPFLHSQATVAAAKLFVSREKWQPAKPTARSVEEVQTFISLVADARIQRELLRGG